MEPGKVRITSDGTIHGSMVEVLTEAGTWAPLKAVARVTIDASGDVVVAHLDVLMPLLSIVADRAPDPCDEAPCPRP